VYITDAYRSIDWLRAKPQYTSQILGSVTSPSQPLIFRVKGPILSDRISIAKAPTRYVVDGPNDQYEAHAVYRGRKVSNVSQEKRFIWRIRM